MKALLRGFTVPLWLLLGLVALASGRPDGATIENSGSTNSRPYRLHVWSDGRIRVEGTQARQAPGAIPKAVVGAFFRDARAAKGAPGAAQACMKSASFGTRIIVAYHGWHSPDLACPQSGVLERLSADVQALTAAAVSQTRADHVHLPINEPRRLPQETPPHPAVSPTP